jgi:glyoxalase/bleomycin resistance protein/dioxygenase superfamily protein
MPTATIDELTIADDPPRWAQLGFVLDGDRVHIGRVVVRLIGRDSGRGMVGWSLRGISGSDLDGLPTGISTRPACEPAGAHPNGVLEIDHVVAITPALDRTAEALEKAGLDLRRVREEPTPAGAPRQAFFRLGREILEVVQEPDEVLARAGGPDRPARFWGLALTVEDLERTVERMDGHAGEIRTAVQPGRRIATVGRSAGLAVPVALMTAAERAVGTR